MAPSVLAALIVILAVADGLIHLALDVFVFQFNFSRGPLPILFLLNCLGYLTLAGVFLATRNGPIARRRWLDVVLIVFALATLVGWFVVTGGRGNPFNLGYTSKVVEVVLIVLALLHWRSLAATPTTVGVLQRE